MSGIASLEIKAELPPLQPGPDGAIRVGSSRITLDVIVEAFEAGLSPEEITEEFDSLQRSDVYSTIAYYIRHKAEVQGYLDIRQRQAEELQKVLEAKGRTPSKERREAIKHHWAELTKDKDAPIGN